MAISSASIKRYLSGGASNSDPLLSLGDVISSTVLATLTLHALFDVVDGTEASAGDTEYRCWYLKNDDSVTAGSFVVGTVYTILTAGTTDFTAIGAANSNVGTTFTATGVGTGTGTAGRTYQSVDIYIKTQTPSSDTAYAIGLDNAGVGDGSTTGVAYDGTGSSEGTAPPSANPGVSTWQAGVGAGNALTIGDIKAGEVQAVWVRRTVTAGASAYSTDNVEITVSGDSSA